MTIVLATPTAAPAVVRVAVPLTVPPVATGTRSFATVDLRSPLTGNSRRPDAAAPLGSSGRWF